ncbi:MAG: DUF420 domain-containing protein [Nitrospinota bacterium]|nr:DUF420 domain-containing protein [Nitrospinota bacterium]
MIDELSGPGILSSRTTLGSDISLFLAIGFILMFLLAGYLARSKKGRAHHRMILASMAAMVFYLVYYIQVRYMGLASVADQRSFPGPDWIYTSILRPLLTVHVTVVSMSLYLSVYMVINGFLARFPMDDGSLTLKTGLARPSKVLWGIALFWLAFLGWLTILSGRFDLYHAAIFLALGFGAPAGMALLIHFTLPKADRRHRIVGRICLLLFSLMLATTVSTYYLLYIAKY